MEIKYPTFLNLNLKLVFNFTINIDINIPNLEMHVFDLVPGSSTYVNVELIGFSAIVIPCAELFKSPQRVLSFMFYWVRICQYTKVDAVICNIRNTIDVKQTKYSYTNRLTHTHSHIYSQLHTLTHTHTH